MKYIFKYILIINFFLAFNINYVFADGTKVSEIEITGNKTISKETILSISSLQKIKEKIFDINELNEIQKKIIESNYFLSVDLNITGNKLIISVVENPIVDFLIFEGFEKNSEYQKYIENKIFLKPNNVFSESLLVKDLVFIKNYLNTLGYLKSNVTYVVKNVSSGFVNVFFKIDLNKKFLVKKIFFIGDKKISSSKLFNVISTTQDNWFSFWSSTNTPSENRLNYDISLLKSFYLSEGYYDVQIPSASIDLLDEQFANITFSINAGNKFVIDKYVVNNDLSFLKKDDQDYINNLLKKNSNLIYNNKQVSDLSNKISVYLQNQGVLADVNFIPNKITNYKLNVVINIKPITNKKIIKNILVLGNDITDEKVIRNKLLFSEGDIFYDNKLHKSKDLLLSLNLFKDVKITHVEENQNVKISVLIQEKPTGEISSGIAVGSTGSNLSFIVRENNFLGQGILLDTSLTLGTEEILGSLSYSNPDFLDTGNTFTNTAYITKTSYDNARYENKAIGSYSSIKYEIYKDLSLENSILISYDKVDVNSGASRIIASQDGNYLSTKYSYSLNLDKRNKKFQPTEGYTLFFGQGLAFPPSDIYSLSNSVGGSFYKEFDEKFIGSIKYKMKSINTINNDNVKLSDRLFLTDTELRGFTFRGVGPKIDGDFIGGNYLYSTTFSSTFPNGIPDKYNISNNIFLDIANVWGSDLDGITDSNTLRSSIGVAVSWVSPIGPISFSYAEPISKANSDSIRNFNFKLGGAF